MILQNQSYLSKSEEGEFMLEHYNKEAEIELIDIIGVLVKRKNIIIFGTIIITLISVGISFVLPKTYKINAIIEPGKRPITDQNGQIIEEKYIESSLSIRETIIGGAYNEFILRRLNIIEDEMPKIIVTVPQKTELIDISIKSTKPQLALNIMMELLSRISEDLQKKIAFEKNKVNSEINIAEIENQIAEDQIKLLEKQIYETKNKITFLEDSRRKVINSNPNDAMVVLLYSNEIKGGQFYLNELQNEEKKHEMQSKKSMAKIDNLRKKLSMIKATEVYKSPYIPEKAIGPNKEIIIIAAFVLGIIVTTMTAFLIEYLENKKK